MKSKNTSCALGTIAALYCLPLNTPVVAFAPSPDNVPINNQKKSRSSLAKISLQAATKQRTENENEINSTETITTARTGARRTFIGEAIKATVTASGLTVGMFLNVDMDGHPVNCECNDCNGNKMEVLSHAPGCQCDSCVHFFRGPLSASAYETEDDDGSKRSADYYAQVIQMRETNARLAASGYPLDTREEEKAKINDAFSSFSYDSAASQSGKKSKDKGTKNTNKRSIEKKD